jgi:hypothetical protein
MVRAFVIEGEMKTDGNGATRAVVGVLFADMQPNAKQLAAMGFTELRHSRRSPLNVEAVTIATGAQIPTAPTFYFFSRSNPIHVTALQLKGGMDGIANRLTYAFDKKRTQPRDFIPAIGGTAAVRIGLADAKGALDARDFQFPRTPPGKPQQRIPAFAR